MARVFGYWDTRGRGETIRCLLHHIGIEFEDKRYEIPAGSLGLQNDEWWKKDKFSLGLDVPNLPYWIDGDFKLTQSVAILRHLGRKYDLVDNTTEHKQAMMDLFEQQCMDLLAKMKMVTHSPTFEDEYPGFVRNLPELMKPFSSYMGNNPWLLGEKLTYVDFLLFEILDRYKVLVPGCLDQFENLNNYVERIETLPNVAKYRLSPKFFKWPFFGPHAKFGNSRQPSIIKKTA